MSLDACARLLAQADPDRFATVMAAPVAARARLLPLYAFNIEIARAPWASAEPLIAEMRLQWWADVVDAIPNGPDAAHEVAGPLAVLVRDRGLPLDVLADMVEARRADIYGDRPTADEFDAYLDRTAGHVMWLAALTLGASPTDQTRVRALAWGQGLAAMFQSVPELRSRGREPLPHDDVPALAAEGLARMGTRFRLSPAIWPAWQARALLRQARRDPARVAEGRLALSEFQKRGSLLLRAALG